MSKRSYEPDNTQVDTRKKIRIDHTEVFDHTPHDAVFPMEWTATINTVMNRIIATGIATGAPMTDMQRLFTSVETFGDLDGASLDNVTTFLIKHAMFTTQVRHSLPLKEVTPALIINFDMINGDNFCEFVWDCINFINGTLDDERGMNIMRLMLKY